VASAAEPSVSIIINNHNYARFLGDAIESALTQDYQPAEVLVVDDGSTDDSRDVIRRFAGSVSPVFQENAGQASALNAGVSASRGEIVCFLDADDCFGPGKVKRIVEVFEQHAVNAKPMMVHHRLRITNAAGNPLNGELIGRLHKSPLNLYRYASRYKSILYEGAPTSGLALNRNLLKRLFPLPTRGIRTSADDFVVKGASLIGELHALEEVLGTYRVHGRNLWHGTHAPKSAGFMETLDAFLNEKLRDAGLQPVLNYADSMHAWGDLFEDRRWRQLCRQVVRLSLRQHDPHTASYVLKIARGVAALTVKAAFLKTAPEAVQNSRMIRKLVGAAGGVPPAEATKFLKP
jgi:glycosyltransferase involved in cell wall biosynthesis